MTTLAAGAPVAPRRARAAAKAAIFMVALTAASAGVYEGAQAFARRMNAPAPAVSYASQSTIDATLSGAWHTPATAGDFRASADITGGNVVSVVRVVP